MYVCVCVYTRTHTHTHSYFFNKRSLPLLSFSDSILHTPILPKGEMPNLFKTVSVSFKFLEVYWDAIDIQHYVSLRCAVCWFDKSSISFWLSHVSELADRLFSTVSMALYRYSQIYFPTCYIHRKFPARQAVVISFRHLTLNMSKYWMCPLH